jgi:hypothetical protein
MLNDKELEIAKGLYREFYATYPEENPTDINTLSKYNFMKEKGFDALKLMQQARKENTKANGSPCLWTKRDHWKGDLF